jgi:hypothetical protein
MTFLASTRWRLFLVAWILYSAHFATNVVREHYPAFSLVEHGTFRVDEYQGFHSDIFVHRDGHSVIGNQVLVSALAAIPLFVFDPLLDALERMSQAKLARGEVPNTEYRTEKANDRNFFRLVKQRGLDLRFGAATVVTSVFFMAPLTALFLVCFYGVLRGRGVADGPAAGLTLLLGFGTPLFHRTSTLNHNMFVMYAMFAAFVLLWVRPGESFPVPLRRRLGAGLAAGAVLATDYIGVVILPVLYAYLVLPRLKTASWAASWRESLAMIAGSLPPIAFLLYSQWAMYGSPFWPGQHWMPDQNIYVHEGMRGFTWPDAELFLQNLFHPGFGLYVWAPILVLALIPTRRYAEETLVLPRRERRYVAVFLAVVLLFCSTNQYARLQWNSGFRYLIPMVPLLFLCLTDHWLRLPRRIRVPIAVAVVLHSWVLTVFRAPADQAWRLFLAEGPQLPWFRVLRQTSSPDLWWLNRWWIPAALLGVVFVAVAGIWQYGASQAARRPVPGTVRPAVRR